MSAYVYLHQPYANTWQYAGRSGGVPGVDSAARTVGQTVMTTNDNTDRSSDLQTALNACSAGQDVRVVGRLQCNSGNISIPDGVGLVGPGRSSATIDFRHSTGYGFKFNGADVGDPNYGWSNTALTVSSAVTAGTATMTVSSASTFTVGYLARIEVANQQNNAAITAGAEPVVVTSGPNTFNRTFIVAVTGKTSNTVTFTPPLPDTYTGLTVQLRPGNSTLSGAGIYNITIDADNATSTQAPVNWASGLDCWFYNVYVKHGNSNYGMQFNNMHRMTIQKCEVAGPTSRGTNGAGIMLGSQGSGNTSCLIIDNILRKSFPNIEINFGSSMNVFAYNFLYDSAVSGGNGAALLEHGPHNCFNLYEGNITPNFEVDGYFGSSSGHTYHRNHIYETNPGVSDRSGTIYKRFTRNIQFLGNSISGSVPPYGDVCGSPNIGNDSRGSPDVSPLGGTFWADAWAAVGTGGYQEQDLDVLLTMVRKGNYYNGSLISGETLGTDVLADSLVFASKPAWFYNLIWPMEAATNTMTSNPAGYRFANGGADPSGAATWSSGLSGKVQLLGKCVLK